METYTVAVVVSFWLDVSSIVSSKVTVTKSKFQPEKISGYFSLLSRRPTIVTPYFSARAAN